MMFPAACYNNEIGNLHQVIEKAAGIERWIKQELNL